MLTTPAFFGLQGGGLYIQGLANLTHSILHSNDVTSAANPAKLALP